MATKAEAKISLVNAFGKAAALTGTAAGGYVYFELARVLIAATDTQAQFNPADHVGPGLAALGISLAAGCTGMYMGHLKRRLVDEFNLQVKRELEKAGFEIVEETDEQGHTRPTYRRIETSSYSPVRSSYNGSFWDGFMLSSLSRSGGSSSGSSWGSSRSSGGGRNNGQGAAIIIAAIVLAAAAAASAFVSYKALKLNFSKVPDLLTAPDPELLAAPAAAAPALPEMK